MAKCQAELGPMKESKVFEHGPAKFLFIFIIGFVVNTEYGDLLTDTSRPSAS
jgi:hypothetical protein